MRIGELAKQHHVDTRTIDYYTKIGLLTYEKESSSNKYRNYTKEAEKRLWKIQILRDIGIPLESTDDVVGIREILDDPSYFDFKRLDEYIATLKKHRDDEIARYDDLIRKAEDMKTFGLPIPLLFRYMDFVNEASEGIDGHILNADQVHAVVDNANYMFSLLSQENYDEIKDILYATFSRVNKIQDKGYESEEAQQIVTRFIQILKKYKAFFVASMFNGFCYPEFIGMIVDDDSEEEVYKSILRLCVNWFIFAWTPEKILDFDTFKEKYKEQIREIDRLYRVIDDDIEISISDSIVNLIGEVFSESFSDTLLLNIYPYIRNLANITRIDEIDKEFGDGVSHFFGEALNYYFEKNYSQIIEKTK